MIKKIIKWLFYLVSGLLFGVLVLNVLLVLNTEGQVYDDISNLPDNDVGLVLGTSHRLHNGDSNMFFFQRIEQTVKLYQAGKIQHIIVSGDNSTPYYNEPAKMKSVLMEKGIPEEVISMDFAGFRTLDSIVRSKLVFGQTNITVITQDFHSYRALYIANFHGINAVASVGEKLPMHVSFKIEFREVFARTVTFWDLYIAKKSPRFLGEKEEIHI